jgi:hypothetical protein
MYEDDEGDDREKRIERECVEQVFGLTGGELERTPWEPWIEIDPPTDSDPLAGRSEYRPWYFKQTTNRYWYEGAPEYASEYARDFDHTYRTVVDDCSFCPPDEVLHEKGRKWVLVAQFASSGECECPNVEDWDGEKHAVNADGCPLCEESPGKKHGYIYLGDGWYELVYICVDVCERCGADTQVDEDGDKFCTCDHDYWPLEQGPREKYSDPETRSEYMYSDENRASWVLPGEVMRWATLCKCEMPVPTNYYAQRCATCKGEIGTVPKSRVGGPPDE